jgi:hypothetical protein
MDKIKRRELLLDLAVSGAPWPQLAKVIVLCEQAGGIEGIVDGATIPAALLKKQPNLCHDKEFVEHWAASGDALWRKNSKGESAFTLAVSALGENQRWGGAEHWIAKAPVKELNDIRARAQHDQRPRTLMEVLLVDSAQCARPAYGKPLPAVEALLARGLKISDANFYDRPAGIQISAPSHWDAFLKEGGDPFAVFNTDDGRRQDWTVWEWLAKYGAGTATSSHVLSWAAINAKGDLEKNQERDYWERLSSLSSNTRVNVGQNMRSHPSWHLLRDNVGRNPLMFAIYQNASSHEEMLSKKAAALLPERDNLGRSLWFYALKEPRALSRDKAIFLSKIEGIAKPSPVSGRGLLAQIALVPENPDNLTSLNLPKWSDIEARGILRILEDGPSNWFAMNDADDRSFAEFFWGKMWVSSSRPESILTLLKLADHFGPAEVSPFTRGTIVAAASYYRGYAGVPSCIITKFSPGALFPDLAGLSEERKKEWLKVIEPGDWQTMLATSTAQVHAKALEDKVSSGTTSPRLRL